jgi:hypothetical protein
MFMTVSTEKFARRPACSLLFALLILSSSCTKESTTGPVAARDEVRGEPISAPMATNAAVTPAPATATVAILNPELPAPTPAAPNVATPTPENPKEPLLVGFDKLASFTYEMPDDLGNTNQVNAAKPASLIPETVRAFDRKSIALKGFMLPLKVEGGLVTELLIMRDQSMCCYGAVPKINEWVSVKMTGKGVKPIMDQPITMFGTLHVGEIRENGYLVGIYQLDGEKMAGPLDL